jgi:ketosteroid isomerase-like protein
MLRTSLPAGLSTRTSHVTLLLLLLLSTACQQQGPTNLANTRAADTSAADETKLLNLDAEWSRAAGAKDVEKTVSYYSDDALIMPPNSPVLTGKAAARTMWSGMFSAPGFGGGWKASKVEVARSGDLAYVTGSYEITEHDASGKPMTDKGKYLEVWKKQSDGNWKCIADMFNTDLPPAPAGSAEKKDASAK